MSNKSVVAITGITGTLGRALGAALLERGYEILAIGRGSEASFRERFSLPCRYVTWDFSVQRRIPREAWAGVEHVVHLAGESIGERRWNAHVKRELFESRVTGTRALVAQLPPSIKTLITASAIGIYGDRSDEILEETSAPSAPVDFLSELCTEWERAAKSAPCRSVQMRIGLVLSPEGGMLQRMTPLFELGLGGRLGSGRQWMSWIHLDDVVGALMLALERNDLNGPINAVAPAPVTNADFSSQMSHATKSRLGPPAPAWGLRLAIGEFAAALLASQRVRPARLEAAGFEFKFPTLAAALQDLFSWKSNRWDRVLYDRVWIPKPLAEVFDFFSKETNLEKITPNTLNFKVLRKSTPSIQQGTLIDYKLGIHGVPARWRTLISDWDPPHRFVDQQLRGPYAKWHHTHSFAALAGGTWVQDRVIYRLPLAAWGGHVVHPLIRRDIEGIFRFRRQSLPRLLR